MNNGCCLTGGQNAISGHGHSCGLLIGESELRIIASRK